MAMTVCFKLPAFNCLSG